MGKMTTLELPANAILFPARCFLCRGPAETTRKIAAVKGIDVAGYGYTNEIELGVPLCLACRTHVRRMRVVWWLVSLLLFLAVMAGLFVWGMERDHMWMVIVAAMLFLGLGFFASAIQPQLLDQWQLGVAGITHRQKGAIVRLSFRSEESAREVEELTRQRMSGVLPVREREFLIEEARKEHEAAKKISPRLIFTILMAAGLLLVFIEPDDEPLALIGMPMIFIGAGGLVDPRLPFAIGKYSKHFTPRFTLIARGVAVAGVIAGIVLAMYRAGLIR